MQRFYVLQTAFRKGTLTACRKYSLDTYKFTRGELQVDSPIPFDWVNGNKFYDAIPCNVGEHLLHNRLFELLTRERITGFDSIPAAISFKDKVIDDYSCLIVTGRVLVEDYYKGEIIDKGPIVPGGSSVIIKKGIYFDENSWDHSDIFLLEETLYVIVTQKVKDLIDKLNLTNILLTDIAESERAIYHITVRHPEVLPFYLDQLKYL
jgi:hypothetical protein